MKSSTGRSLAEGTATTKGSSQKRVFEEAGYLVLGPGGDGDIELVLGQQCQDFGG